MDKRDEQFPWEFPMHVYFYCYPGKPLTGSHKRKSARAKDAPWHGETRKIASRPICELRKYQKSDRVAYWSYIRVALAAGVSPLSAEQWLLLSRAPDITREGRGQTDEERARTRKEQERAQLFADLATLGGFQIVEMRPGGSFGGVRRQTSAIGGRGHLLTLKTCKKCLELLPAFCFAKQLKGRRSACRWCDNAARVDRRRTRKTA